MKNENINYIHFQDCFGKYIYSKETKLITFNDTIEFYISSASNEFIQYLISTILLENNIIRLWNNEAKIEKVEILKEPEFNEECEISTLSPITVYSTFQNQFRKKTYYYNPSEPEFYELTKQNLLKKYQAFYNEIPENNEFEMKSIGRYRERFMIYKKDFIVKAYDGKFLIKGNPKLIKLAYEAGIASRNSAGFGMIKIN